LIAMNLHAYTFAKRWRPEGFMDSLVLFCNGGAALAHALLPVKPGDLGASSTPVEGAKTVW